MLPALPIITQYNRSLPWPPREQGTRDNLYGASPFPRPTFSLHETSAENATHRAYHVSQPRFLSLKWEISLTASTSSSQRIPCCTVKSWSPPKHPDFSLNTLTSLPCLRQRQSPLRRIPQWLRLHGETTSGTGSSCTCSNSSHGTQSRAIAYQLPSCKHQVETAVTREATTAITS